jgi:hypothetical protein
MVRSLLGLKCGGALCAQDRLFGVPIGAPPQLRTASAPAGAEAAAEGDEFPAEGDTTTTSGDGDDKTVTICGLTAGASAWLGWIPDASPQP